MLFFTFLICCVSQTFAFQVVQNVTFQNGVLEFLLWSPYTQLQLFSDDVHAHGEKGVHLVAISDDREVFLHLHPNERNGTWSCTFDGIDFNAKTWTFSLQTAVKSNARELELIGVVNLPQNSIPLSTTFILQSISQQHSLKQNIQSLSTSISGYKVRKGVLVHKPFLMSAPIETTETIYHLDAEVLSRSTIQPGLMTNNVTLPYILGTHCNVFKFRLARTVPDRFATIYPNTQAVNDVTPWLDSYMHIVAIHSSGWALHTHAVPVPKWAITTPDLCVQGNTEGWYDQPMEELDGPIFVAPMSLPQDGHYDLFVQFTANPEPNSLNVDMVVGRLTFYKGMRAVLAEDVSQTVNPVNPTIIILPILALAGIILAIVVWKILQNNAYKQPAEAKITDSLKDTLLDKDFEDFA
jgi:hypothetical protein